MSPKKEEEESVVEIMAILRESASGPSEGKGEEALDLKEENFDQPYNWMFVFWLPIVHATALYALIFCVPQLKLASLAFRKLNALLCIQLSQSFSNFPP